MTQERLSLGKMGEELAVTQLKAMKYQILERNYRCPLGEMDIIAREKGSLVFVEVKTRATRDFGGPAAAVHERKQRQLSRVALLYLNHKKIRDIPATDLHICLYRRTACRVHLSACLRSSGTPCSLQLQTWHL